MPVAADPAWQACHEQHVREIQQADEAEQGFGLVFFGDSITESWSGTDLCKPVPRAQGVDEVFRRHFAKWNASVMAVGGDQTAHLQWRIMNGEVPAKNKPRVAVVLIGTNDLGAAAWEAPDVHSAEAAVMRAVPGVTLRVLRTLHTLKDMLPESHIVLMALLPRGGGWPGPHGAAHWPSVFTEALEVVNAHYRDYTRLDGYLHFIDCAERFLTPDRRAIRTDLMPDVLHPNPEGYELLAECLDPLVTKLMQHPSVPTVLTLRGPRGGQAPADE
ncbi:hypothetical protein ABPG75_005452 [Micractinium tetrahymenae]